MPANNPNNVNAQTVQGPDPTGNQGYPIAVVPATGADPFPIGPLPPGSTIVVSDILDGAGDSIMDAVLNAARVVVSNTTPIPISGTVDTELDASAPLSDSTANPNTARVGACLMVFDEAAVQWERVRMPSGIADNETAPQSITNAPLGFNGVSYIKIRTSSVFRTVATAAAGNTALWTPGAGNRFRLQRYMISVSGDAFQAVAGVITITLFDGAAGATNQIHSVFVPAAALNIGSLYTTPWIDLTNGVRSAALNNVLNVNLSAALAGGVVRVLCCGNEEG